MGLTERAHTHCDGCGRDMAKAAILFEGKAFCLSCYKKRFKPTICSSCGLTTRSLDGKPVNCKACRSKGRRCRDCGVALTEKNLAMVLPDGALCDRCRRNLKAPKACPSCGKVTKWLSKDVKSGFFDPVCSTCRHKSHTFQKCSRCGGNRYHYATIDEKSVCYSCHSAQITTACSGCGTDRLPPGATICANCSSRQATRERSQQMSEELSEWRRAAFLDFTEEVLASVRLDNCLPMLERHFKFFALLEHFGVNPPVEAAVLLERLTPKQQVDHLTPYLFLVRQKLIVNDSEELRDETRVRQTCEALLLKTKGAWYEKTLREFSGHLWSLHGAYRRRGWKGKRARFLPGTVKQELLVTYRFCASLTDVQKTTQLDQGHLDAFLAVRPGYRASLNRFVQFLKKEGHIFWAIESPKIEKHINLLKKLPDNRLKELVKIWKSPPDGQVRDALICLLMLLYAQRPPNLSKLTIDLLARDKNGNFRLKFYKVWVQLHPLVGGIVERYLAERDQDSEYLFPGRRPGSHLSVSTIKTIPLQYNVSPSELFVTAMLRQRLFGVTVPDALTRTLKVSRKVATNYISVYDIRANNDVRRVLKKRE